MADEGGFGHSVVLSGATLIGGLALFGIYVGWLPDLLETFYALRMDLPYLTKLMLMLGGFAQKFWFIVLPIVIVGPIPPLFLMGRGTGQRVLAHMAVVQLLVALFTCAGIYMPFAQIGAVVRADPKAQTTGASVPVPLEGGAPSTATPTAAPR